MLEHVRMDAIFPLTGRDATDKRLLFELKRLLLSYQRYRWCYCGCCWHWQWYYQIFVSTSEVNISDDVRDAANIELNIDESANQNTVFLLLPICFPNLFTISSYCTMLITTAGTYVQSVTSPYIACVTKRSCLRLVTHWALVILRQ